jgi:NADH-quinone oxidoreductase subunit C
MSNHTLTEALADRFKDKQIEESFGMPALHIEKDELIACARTLKEEKVFDFKMLVCETAVDRTEHFELVCHLRSLSHGHEMILKTHVERDGTPELHSLYGLWHAAELFEDEIYDLFGIRFAGHPFLRRIMLDDSFNGYPLRKDFINTEEL